MKRWLLVLLIVLPVSAGVYGPSGGGGISQAEADLRYAPISVSLAGAWPVGAVFVSTSPTNPATMLGFGTWTAFGAGRVLVGQDPGDAAFDVVEEAGGAKTVVSAGANSAPVFTGTPFTQVINHAHPVTDPGHAHPVTSQTATTGSSTSYEHGTLDTSSADTEATEVTGSATTGVTTANPVGGVASITPAGSISAPTFTGSATSVVQPYIVVYFWKRAL